MIQRECPIMDWILLKEERCKYLHFSQHENMKYFHNMKSTGIARVALLWPQAHIYTSSRYRVQPQQALENNNWQALLCCRRNHHSFQKPSEHVVSLQFLCSLLGKKLTSYTWCKLHISSLGKLLFSLEKQSANSLKARYWVTDNSNNNI